MYQNNIKINQSTDQIRNKFIRPNANFYGIQNSQYDLNLRNNKSIQNLDKKQSFDLENIFQDKLLKNNSILRHEINDEIFNFESSNLRYKKALDGKKGRRTVLRSKDLTASKNVDINKNLKNFKNLNEKIVNNQLEQKKNLYSPRKTVTNLQVFNTYGSDTIFNKQANAIFTEIGHDSIYKSKESLVNTMEDQNKNSIQYMYTINNVEQMKQIILDQKRNEQRALSQMALVSNVTLSQSIQQKSDQIQSLDTKKDQSNEQNQQQYSNTEFEYSKDNIFTLRKNDENNVYSQKKVQLTNSTNSNQKSPQIHKEFKSRNNEMDIDELYNLNIKKKGNGNFNSYRVQNNSILEDESKQSWTQSKDVNYSIHNYSSSQLQNQIHSQIINQYQNTSKINNSISKTFKKNEKKIISQIQNTSPKSIDKKSYYIFQRDNSMNDDKLPILRQQNIFDQQIKLKIPEVHKTSILKYKSQKDLQIIQMKQAIQGARHIQNASNNSFITNKLISNSNNQFKDSLERIPNKLQKSVFLDHQRNSTKKQLSNFINNRLSLLENKIDQNKDHQKLFPFLKENSQINRLNNKELDSIFPSINVQTKEIQLKGIQNEPDIISNRQDQQVNQISQKQLNKVYEIINSSQSDMYKALGVKVKTLKHGQIIDKLQKSLQQQKQIKNKINMFHPLKGSNNPHLIEYQKQLQLRKNQLMNAMDDQIEYFQGIQDSQQNLKTQQKAEKQQKTSKNHFHQRANSDGIEINHQRKKENKEQFNIEQQNIFENTMVKRSAEDYLKSLRSLDQIDFELKQKIQGGCESCSKMQSKEIYNYAKADPKMFQHVVNIKKIVDNKKFTQVKQFELEDEISYQYYDSLNDQQKEFLRKQNFSEWLTQMEKHYKEFVKQKEYNLRPKYIQLFQKARSKHMEQYNIDLSMRTFLEQEIKESIDRTEKTQADFKHILQHLLDQQNIDYNQFIFNLIIIQKDEDRQNQFYNELQDKSFIQKKDSIFDIINQNLLNKQELEEEEELEPKPSVNIKNENFVDQLLNLRNKQNFLQIQNKEIFMGKNLDLTLNQNIEYAKQSHLNLGMVNTELIINKERSRIDYGRCVVINQNLLPEQTISLVNSIRLSNEYFNQLLFANNQMSSSQFNDILSSLSPVQTDQIQSIVYVGKNSIGTDSLGTLINKYLTKTGPFTLIELKFINLNIYDSICFQDMLVQFTNDFKLENLTLSKINLQSRQIDEICKFLKSGPHSLKMLDLSWNKIQSHQLKDLYESLQMNKNMTHVNLAYNPVSTDYNIKELTIFLQINQTSLQHLDLSGVLQTQFQVMKVIKKISKSQTLVSVHLNDTEVLTNDFDLLQYIYAKLRMKPEFQIQSNQNIKIQQDQISYEEIDQLKKYEFTLKSKQTLREREYFRVQSYVNTAQQSNNVYILQRIIAHSEIENNKEWMVSQDSCYVCDRWQYTIFISCQQKQNFQINPYIQGNMSLLCNKKQKNGLSQIKMNDIRYFARTVIEEYQDAEKNKKNYLEIVGEQIRKKIEKTSKDLEKFEQKYEQQDLTLYQELLPNGQYLYQCIIQERIRSKSVQFLPYITNFDEFNDLCSQMQTKDIPDIFVYADYVKPSHLIQWVQIGQEIHKFIPSIRISSIPNFSLSKFEKEDEIIVFNKEKSVFKAWQKDTPNILRQALKNDFGYWRAARVVKDPTEFMLCEHVIEKNFEALKNMFINLISGDNYPHIGANDFLAFCRKVEILDETLPSSYVEISWSGLMSGNRPAGPGNTLYRHEFLEILIRIGNAKYRDTGRAKSSSQSLEMLLNSIIPKFSARPWQEFRDSSLWAKDVDAIYKANNENLIRVHEYLFPRQTELGLKNCIELMCKSSNLQASEKEVRFCFGMSKMTVKDEIGNQAEYEKLRYPEFLEFIGRLAHGKFYEERDLPLSPKIQRVLISIFQVFGFRYREPESLIVEISSSDESLQDYKEKQTIKSTR